MKNIVLFIITWKLYYLLLSATIFADQGLSLPLTILLGILCVPFKIGKNIYTVLGNSVNEEGNTYSLASFFQISKGSSFNLIGIGGVQMSDKEECFTALGIVSLQSGDESVLWAGITLVQIGTSDVLTVFGIAIYQNSREHEADMLVGVVVSQNSFTKSYVGIGLSAIQLSDRRSEVLFGLVLFQMSIDGPVRIYIGGSVAQVGTVTEAENAFVLYQRLIKTRWCPDKSRSFAIRSILTRDEQPK